jgi:hypothetical protein
MKINWKWPETPMNGLVPWYLIAYRAVFMPIIYAGIALTWLGITLSNGPDTAKRWLKSAT